MPEPPPCDACGEPSCPTPWNTCIKVWEARYSDTGFDAYLCRVCWGWTATRVREAIRSRRAAAKAGPEMYGTMPDVLPETLPVGTRLAINSSGKYVAVDPLTLFRSETGTARYGLRGERYSMDGVEKHCGQLGFMPERIDWTTVPKQPAAKAEQWIPKVGDWCEGVTRECAWYADGTRVVGELNALFGADSAWLYVEHRGPRRDVRCDLASLRPAKRLAAEKTPAVGSAVAAPRKDADATPSGEVNKPSAQPAAGDPYANFPYGMNEAQIAAAQAEHDATYRSGVNDWREQSTDQLDRLAAARARRPSPEPARADERRDPADWDCWDGPELTVS